MMAQRKLSGGLANKVLRKLLSLYRLVVSPLVGPACRFEPTCSNYASEALEKHGSISGIWLAVKRLGRCHPLGGSGYDPVP